MTAHGPPVGPVKVLLTEAIRNWNAIPTGTDARLLRLNILRNLSRALHAAASRVAASPKLSTQGELSVFLLEAQVSALRDGGDLSRDLAELVREDPPPPDGSRVTPPDPIIEILGPERLNRPDRPWERALAVEASRAGWRFWAVEAGPEPAEAQMLHDSLNQRAPRQMLVLFVESAPRRSAEVWRGRWYIVGKPGWEPKAGPGEEWILLFPHDSE